MILICLTQMQYKPCDRGFNDANASYWNPHHIIGYKPVVVSGSNSKEVAATRVKFKDHPAVDVEETAGEIAGLVNLATRRKLPPSIACVDKTIMKNLFQVAGELENDG